MRRFPLGIVVAALLSAPSVASASERELLVGFHEAGHVVIDQLSGLRLGPSGASYAGPAGVAVRTERLGEVESKATSLWLAPSGDVFVTDHLSVGGVVEVSHTFGAWKRGEVTTDVPAATGVRAVPRLGFFTPFGDRFGLWVRAGVGYLRSEQVTTTSGGTPTRATFAAAAIEADASLVYRFTESFFLRVGPEVGTTLGGRSHVDTAGDASVLHVAGAASFGMNLEP